MNLLRNFNCSYKIFIPWASPGQSADANY